jgi:hypothetical protein
MKLLHGSDLHTEFGRLERIPTPPYGEFDAVLLTGDIGMGTDGAKWAIDTFNGVPIIYIPGNHEFYRHYYGKVREDLEELAEDNLHFHVLKPGVFKLNDEWVLIGATLWSALRTPGGVYMGDDAERQISDFMVIGHELDGRWSARAHTQAFVDDVKFIQEQLELYKDKKVVVATHFLPSHSCTHPKYLGSPLNGYFASDCDFVMEEANIPYWIFGHTHDRMVIDHPTGTKLISNPAGYPGENREKFEWQILTL